MTVAFDLSMDITYDVSITKAPNSTCSCSSHGSCVFDVCKCDPGFTGYDCSMAVTVLKTGPVYL